jgi:hypothetical protein
MSFLETSQLIPCRETTTVCFEMHNSYIHTYIHTFCKINAEFINVKPGGLLSKQWILKSYDYSLFWVLFSIGTGQRAYLSFFSRIREEEKRDFFLRLRCKDFPEERIGKDDKRSLHVFNTNCLFLT